MVIIVLRFVFLKGKVVVCIILLLVIFGFCVLLFGIDVIDGLMFIWIVL